MHPFLLQNYKFISKQNTIERVFGAQIRHLKPKNVKSVTRELGSSDLRSSCLRANLENFGLEKLYFINLCLEKNMFENIVIILISKK